MIKIIKVFFPALALALANCAFAGGYEVKNILVATYSGVINPVSAEYFSGAVDECNAIKCDMLVLRLDTPGGLDVSMRTIIKKILSSEKPVVVYIYPKGARAASAGVFITMASDVAAMSPGTNIGAAHPVMLGRTPPAQGNGKEKKSDAMEDKVLNDASAYIRSITQRTKRNTDWAIRAVTKSDSLSVEEALEKKVTDIIAEDLEDLLKKTDGFVSEKFGRIEMKNPEITYYELTQRQKFLAAVTDPNIAMILMSLGAAGLFIELYNPGLIFPGVIGALSIILAFYSFQTLSANFAGLLLIFLGLVFFLLEIKIMSYGLLSLSAIISIVLGSLMLFGNNMGGLGIYMETILTTIIGLIVIVGVLAWIVIKAHTRKVVTGIEGIKGMKAVVKERIAPKGKILCEGELWDAVSAEGEIETGESVVVEEVDGFKVKVRKL